MKNKESKPQNAQDGTEVEGFQSRDPADEYLDLVEYTYINWARAISNNWDVRIAFGDRSVKAIKPKIGIAMSHQHFKAFVEALNTQLQRLEETFGTVHYTALADRESEEGES